MTRLRKLFFVAIAGAAAACGWDPSRPFDRESPQVNEALGQYDAGEAGSAADLLEDYLATGGCAEGNIGTPPRLRDKPNGSFDLGLALFKIAEQYGHRFGDEENDAGFLDPNLGKLRAAQVDCALRVVRAVAEDTAQPLALRARARYLEGNLLFLTGQYKEAVTAYEKALELVPAMADSGPIGSSYEAGAFDIDPIGRDAAWNRAVALRRIEDKKDAGNDASSGDGGNGDGGSNDDNPDGGSKDQNKDGGGKDNKHKDGGKDDKKDKDKGKDGGGNDKKDEPNKNNSDNQQDAGAPPPPPSRQNQDDRILDQLENAPTVQQEAAKKQARKHPVKGGQDK
jgi:tetratricopeptide (TPR) repeat protein